MLKVPIKQKLKTPKDKKGYKLIKEINSWYYVRLCILGVSSHVYHGTSMESELDTPVDRSHQ